MRRRWSTMCYFAFASRSTAHWRGRRCWFARDNQRSTWEAVTHLAPALGPISASASSAVNSSHSRDRANCGADECRLASANAACVLQIYLCIHAAVEVGALGHTSRLRDSPCLGKMLDIRFYVHVQLDI